MPDLSAIEQIIAKKRIVEIEGVELILKVPKKLSDAISIRQQVIKSQHDMSDEDMASLGLNTATKTVAICLEIDEEMAGQLVLASGGEFGVLAREAFALCGLRNVMDRAMAEGINENPT